MNLASLIVATGFSVGLASAQTLDSILLRYESEKERILHPLEVKFDAALEKLLQKLTAAEKLDESLEVDQLIKERLSSLSPSYIWLWPDNKRLLEFSPDGIATFSSWSGTGTWKRVDDKIIEITNPDGNVAQLTILSAESGIYRSGAGRMSTYSLKKLLRTD